MSLALAVDISEGEDLSPETLAGWRDAGVKKVIVQYSAKLPDYLNQLDGQGFKVEVYVYLYFPLSPWNQPPEERVAAALAMCQGHQIGRVWLDVEEPTDPTDPVSQSRTVASLLLCLALINNAGLPGDIYSGRYTYEAHTGNSTAFADQGVNLWNADYTRESPEADLSGKPTELVFPHGAYGGWVKPSMWQWHNTTMFCGHSVDISIYEDEENDMANLNADGSKRIVAEVCEDGVERIVIYNNNVPVLRVGGDTPGMIAKNFGGNWMYVRGLTDDGNGGVTWAQAPYFSNQPGD